MRKMCKAINGVLVLLAGAALFTNMAVAGMNALQIAGLLFVLFGIIKLAHAAGLCGMCGSCCSMEGKKK